MIINILRGVSTVTASFRVSEDVKFVSQLMGERKIAANFQSEAVLDIRIGDYIIHNSEVFTINNQPEVTKLANRMYDYTVEFEAEIYGLYNKIIMDEGSADFSYFGTPEDYIDLLLLNINSIDSGWTAGTIAAVEPKPLTFNNETCRQALTRIAELFELEFNVIDKQINMVGNVGNDISLQLQYGKGNGLYSLTRKRLNDQSVITRLFTFGGSKNIDFDYRDGASRLIFEGGKLESNISLYGVREGSITFDDVFPQRSAAVGFLPAFYNLFTIIDTTIDFDINDFLLEGVTAKIAFKSGDLAGYQFEITEYNHTFKRITFKEFVEENDYKLPNSVVKVAIGDQYTLIDIKMPPSYIATAEALLQQKAQDYLDANDHPTVTYAFECDEKFLQDGSINFRVGDEVRIIDAALTVDSTLRISELTYPLLYPKRISAAISEGVEYTTIERIIKVTSQQIKDLRIVDKTSQEQARLQQLRFRELQGLLFDPDGFFDTTNIRPNSIQTLQLAVGVKSQQFALSGVVFSPNQNGLPANFFWSGGELVHFEIAANIRTWQLASGGRADLLPSDAYYIYARCPLVGAQGTIIATTAQIKVESEAGFFNFLIGVVHSVIDGVRAISLTYGQT